MIPFSSILRVARAVCVSACAGCCLIGATASGITLKFKDATATFEPADGGGRIGDAIDGVLNADNGWRLNGGQYRPQGAVFILDKPVTASIYQVQVSSLSSELGSHPACFAVSVTTDAEPSLRSNWTPLIPYTAFLNDFSQVKQGGIEFHGGRIVIHPHRDHTVLTFRSRAPVGNVTAFSIRLFPYIFETSPAKRPAIGCDAQGSMTLTEFRVESDPLRTTNIAIGRNASSSGPIVAYLPVWYLTDGFDSTFTHPENSGGEPFHFDLDLGKDTDFDHIVIRGRGDGRCPERLSRYRVQLIPDGTDTPSWEATLRSDGSNPGVGGSDVIRSREGKGAFRGRYLRLLNQPGQAFSPQMAELEVYPALHPVLAEWVADGTPIASAPEMEVSTRHNRIDFAIRATALPSVRDLIVYRWKLVGRDDTWHETDSSGKATMRPTPPEGHYRLIAQARHSNGRWDESEANISFSVAPPWWRRPGSLIGLLVAAVLLIWGICWAAAVRRIKSELSLAEHRGALNNERLRISRDMHDDVGARLTGLALLADRCLKTGSTEALEHLSAEARETVAALDEIVWSVSPLHDTVGSLVEYVEDHALNYLQAAGIGCTLEVSLPTPDQPIDLAKRHHLLMASKEALQNIVKHAHATEVAVALLQEPTALILRFSDNGQGLPSDLPGIHGDGLDNMRARLHDSGGSCEIRTSPAGGTTVLLRLPLKIAPPSA